MLLVQRINSVLPVDLYDTTCESDIHLNSELVNVLTEVYSIKNDQAGTSSSVTQP